MARPWSEVAADPNFTALDVQAQEKVRNHYFETQVAPRVPADQVGKIRQKFDQDTQLKNTDLDKRMAEFGSIGPPAAPPGRLEQAGRTALEFTGVPAAVRLGKDIAAGQSSAFGEEGAASSPLDALTLLTMAGGAGIAAKTGTSLAKSAGIALGGAAGAGAGEAAAGPEAKAGAEKLRKAYPNSKLAKAGAAALEMAPSALGSVLLNPAAIRGAINKFRGGAEPVQVQGRYIDEPMAPLGGERGLPAPTDLSKLQPVEGLPTATDRLANFKRITGEQHFGAWEPTGIATQDQADLLKRAARNQGSQAMAERMEPPTDWEGRLAELQIPKEEVPLPPARPTMRLLAPSLAPGDWAVVEGMEKSGPAEIIAQTSAGPTVRFPDGRQIKLSGATLTPAQRPATQEPLPIEQGGAKSYQDASKSIRPGVANQADRARMRETFEATDFARRRRDRADTPEEAKRWSGIMEEYISKAEALAKQLPPAVRVANLGRAASDFEAMALKFENKANDFYKKGDESLGAHWADAAEKAREKSSIWKRIGGIVDENPRREGAQVANPGLPEPVSEPENVPHGTMTPEEEAALRQEAEKSMKLQATAEIGGHTPLLDFIRDNGGISHEETKKSGLLGEFVDMKGSGLFRKNGKRPSDMMRSAAEAGLIEEASPQAFSDKINNEWKALAGAKESMTPAEYAKLRKETKRSGFRMGVEIFPGSRALADLSETMANKLEEADRVRANMNLAVDAVGAKDWRVKKIATLILPPNTVLERTASQYDLLMRDAHRDIDKFYNAYRQAWAPIEKSPEAMVKVFNFLDGKLRPEAMTPLEIQVADKMRQISDHFYFGYLNAPESKFNPSHAPHVWMDPKKYNVDDVGLNFDKNGPVGLRKRKGAQGYTTDPRAAYFAYLYRNVLDAHMAPFIASKRAEFGKQNLNHLQSRYADRYLEMLQGQPGAIEKVLNEMGRAVTESVPMIKNLARIGIHVDNPRRTAQNITSNLYVALLGGRIASGIRQLPQLGAVYAEMGPRAFAAGAPGAFRSVFTKKGRAILREQGVNASILHDAMQRAQFVNNPHTEALREILMKPTSIADNFTRGWAYHAALSKGMRLGMEGQKLLDYAFTEASKTNFPVGRSSRNPFFDNPIGILALPFKKFPVNQISLVGKWAQDRQYGKIINMLLFDGAVIGGLAAGGVEATNLMGWEPLEKIPVPTKLGEKLKGKVMDMRVPGALQKIGFPGTVGEIKAPIGAALQLANKFAVSGRTFGADEKSFSGLALKAFTALGIPVVAAKEYGKLITELREGKQVKKIPVTVNGQILQKEIKVPISPADALKKYFKVLPPDKVEQMKDQMKRRMRQLKVPIPDAVMQALEA